ncbi:hypothetical protein [Candidatus Leptofilum sp.]|uniref:hypothetical protein n=1 Tax=Candidatus Leptofilum sp. TaxID=3241576 RepID=UPI003B5AD35B
MAKKIVSLIGLLLFLLLGGCAGSGTPSPEALPPTAVPNTITPALETAVPTIDIPPTNTAPPPAPTETAVPPEPDLSIEADNIFLYPVPELYAGDRVTFQILAHVPSTVDPRSVTVHVLVNYQDVAEGTLNARNLAGDAVGLFEWAWDTTDEAGDQLVHIILDRYDEITEGDENRDNNEVVLTVPVLDPQNLPPNERGATWVTAETSCCNVHVVSGTAAYRDLPEILVTVETAVAQAATRLEELSNRKIDVYLIDRVIGQGGYAGNAMVVSYLDRHYASRGFEQILIHEAIHILDRQFAPERIPFLAEGMAVWGSGGHYKQENIHQRAAALVALNQYIPLAQLIDDFYPVQHEIGYLEAAGFVAYLVDTYSYPQFKSFYADVTAQDANTLSQAVDLNLQQYYGLTLAQAEADWLAFLVSLPEDQAQLTDLQTTLRYFNVMRRYQRFYDPTAYFLTAWLPYPGALQTEGNPADLTRHPQAEVNVTLEVMLQAADVALRAGDYNKANVLLDSITRVLDNDGIFIDPLAASYLNLVQQLTEQGYEVQAVSLDGDRAEVQVTGWGTAVLTPLTLTLSGQNWILSN